MKRATAGGIVLLFAVVLISAAAILAMNDKNHLEFAKQANFVKYTCIHRSVQIERIKGSFIETALSRQIVPNSITLECRLWTDGSTP